MKKLMILPVVLLAISMSSCEILNQFIPDVEKVVSQKFTITIDDNTAVGISEDEFIDITEYDEYQDNEQYITGFELNKVTYTIMNYDAPEDLYFEGEVVAFDDGGTTMAYLADIGSVKLADIADMTEDQPTTEDQSAFDQVIEWLDDPGSFNLHVEYEFQNSDGTSYSFDPADYGSSFEVKVSFHFTLLTGL